MNRRGFLKLFAGAGAAAIVVPKVSYFFAPAHGWQPKCQPGCVEHLHRWQVEKFVKDYEQRIMGETIQSYRQPTEAEWKAGKPMDVFGVPFYYSQSATDGIFLGVKRSHRDFPTTRRRSARA